MSDVSTPSPQHTQLDGAPDTGQAIPPAGSQPVAASDPELLLRFIDWYKTARDHFQEWRQEAAEAYDFVAGHQWAEEDLQTLRDQMRPAITFNRIGPFIDAVSGFEINNRQETRFLPRTPGESGVNDLLTGAAQWARQECDAEDEETEAFVDAVVCGMGWTQTRLDFADNPDGMIVIERIDPLEMLPDPATARSNMGDARFLIRAKDVPLRSAEELFPDRDPADLHAQWAEDQPDETRTPHNARLAPYYRIDQAGQIDRSRQMVRLVEVEWWDYEGAYRVIDPATGRLVRLSDRDATVYAMRARALGIKPHMIKDRRKQFYKAIVGAEVLKVVRGAEEGGFSYKSITGKRDRNRGCWYGLVRAMKDPQMWANKWLSQALHIINTNAKGGLMAEEDAFVDIDEARDEWSQPDSITLFTPGALSQGKVQQKNPPQFPQAITELMQFAVSSIPQVNGINLELLGQSTTAQPQAAVLEAGRKQQGMNVLAGLFNAKRRYLKEQGRLMLWLIQTFIADGRLIRIGGPENAQYVPLIHQPGLAEYDVIVDDAPTSPNMKERVWSALMQMFPLLRGMPIPPQFYVNALKYAPIPESFVTESQQILSQPPPPNPAMQGKVALDQANAELKQAQAKQVQAQAAHTMAQIQGMPDTAALQAMETAASIDLKHAQATNQLQNAGIATHDALQRADKHAHDTAKALAEHFLTATDQAHQHNMDMIQQAHSMTQRAEPAVGVPGGQK